MLASWRFAADCGELAMNPATLVSLNMRELDRLKVIQAIVEMGLKPGRAAVWSLP